MTTGSKKIPQTKKKNLTELKLFCLSFGLQRESGNLAFKADHE